MRSQDRRILQKVDNIFLDANYENKRISTYDGDNTELGIYKTRERAIEILDEIQRLLEKDKFEEDRYCCDKLTKAIVYEMPKE